MGPPWNLLSNSVFEVTTELASSRLFSGYIFPAAVIGAAAPTRHFLMRGGAVRGGAAVHAEGTILGNPLLFLRPKKKKLRPDRSRTQRHLKNKRHIGGWFYKWLGS
ncbi:hypothetical protein ACSSS7_007073 [Eimeria intestinalis]